MKLSKTANILIITSFSIFILVYGKDILIPFVLALFLWFIVKEIRMAMQKVKVIRDYLPPWFLNVFATTILFLVGSFLVQILTNNINIISANIPKYEANIHHVQSLIEEMTGLDLMARAKEFSGGINFSDILSSLVNSLSSIVSNLVLILIYFLFLLLEESGFGKKIAAIAKGKNDQTQQLLSKIDHSIGSYITLKTVVSLVTGVVSFIALLFFKVDAPVFWAFIIFLLNYIPTVGSLIATIFPSTFFLIQTGEVMPAVYVLVVITVIQLLVGNLLEPLLMGDRLNVSALVVLIALAVWGTIWGIPGMVLSVPLTVIMIILFSEFETTKPIAILLSDKGKV